MGRRTLLYPDLMSDQAAAAGALVPATPARVEAVLLSMIRQCQEKPLAESLVKPAEETPTQKALLVFLTVHVDVAELRLLHGNNQCTLLQAQPTEMVGCCYAVLVVADGRMAAAVGHLLHLACDPHAT